MGRSFLYLVAGLVLGTLVGLWQPHRELLRMREAMEENERELAVAKRRGAAAGIASLFHPTSPARAPADSVEAAGPPGAEVPSAGEEPEPTVVAEEVSPAEGPPGPVPETPQTMEAVSEALDARAAQARAALLEQTDLDDDQLAAFDAAVDRMNERLQKSVDELVAHLEAGEEPDRRDLMELGAEGLDAMIEADDAIAGVIPEEVRESVDEEVLDPFSYVDGSTLAGLAQLEGLGEP